MKKIYIFVLSAVTVFCVILGTLVHVGGWLDLGFFPSAAILAAVRNIQKNSRDSVLWISMRL